MSGLGIQAIKVALAAQLVEHIDRGITVRPYRTAVDPKPCITMEITDITYYESMGAAGLAGFNLDVKLWVATGDRDSDDIVMADFLSGGTGNASSIFDALNWGDHTIGSVVDSCRCLEVKPPEDDREDNFTAVFPVQILCRKVGAQA